MFTPNTVTNGRNSKPSKFGSVGLRGDAPLRVCCPNCDTRRSGPCCHHKPRLRIHLAKAQQPVIRLSVNDDNTDYYDETPEFQIGYRRPELVNQTAKVHNDLSDEIKLRLLLARKRALQAYQQNWG